MTLNHKHSKIYIISGTDDYIDDQIDTIIKDLDDPEIERFESENIILEEYYSFIYTPSLFNTQKLAIIKNAEKIKKFDEILRNSIKASFNTKIFYFNNITTSNLKAFENIENVKTLIQKKRTYKDNINYIIQLFKKANINIEYNVARDIYELSLRDLGIVKNELEKIKLYITTPALQETQSIKISDITELPTFFSFGTKMAVFSFIDCFCIKDRGKTFLMLEDILGSEENFNIVFILLFKRIKQIMLYKLAPSIVKDQPFIMDKIKNNSKLWELEELVKILEDFINIDFLGKTANVSLENCLVSLVNSI